MTWGGGGAYKLCTRRNVCESGHRLVAGAGMMAAEEHMQESGRKRWQRRHAGQRGGARLRTHP